MNLTCIECKVSLLCLTNNIKYVASCRDCDNVEAARRVMSGERVCMDIDYLRVSGRCPRRDREEEKTGTYIFSCEECLENERST